MASLNYYLGPWLWNSERSCFESPAGVVGSLDFGTLPDMGVGGSDRRLGFFCAPPSASIPSEFARLAENCDFRSTFSTSAMQDAFELELGVRPVGQYLVDLVEYIFDNGDPSGLSLPKPRTPSQRDTGLVTELWLGGHSLVTARAWLGTADPRWNRIRQIHRLDLQQHDDECKADAKRLRDEATALRKQTGGTAAAKKKRLQLATEKESRAAYIEPHAEKVLDGLCIKYDCDPTEFSTTIRRGKASTTISDDFTHADGDGIGNTLTWTTYGTVVWETSSNKARPKTTNADCWGRSETALSASDMYAQCKVINSSWAGTWNTAGPCARYSTSANTHYMIEAYVQSGYYQTTRKVVTGTVTSIGTSNAYGSPATGDTIKLSVSGSTLIGYRNGGEGATVTDTALSTGTMAGIHAYWLGGTANIEIDDFYATDGIVVTAGAPFAVNKDGNKWGGRCK